MLASVASLTGCPGTLDNPERFTGDDGTDCPDVPTVIFAQRCATPSCHMGAMAAANLDLTAGGLEARVAGQPGTATCGSALLADPASPEDSLLYTKLEDVPSCGAKMPFGGSLDDIEKQCILDWIGTLPAARISGPISGDGIGN